MMFEQVYRYGETDQKLPIRKLAPRLPGSISKVAVASDGGLHHIRQHPSGQQSGVPGTSGSATTPFGLQSPQILVDRLVAYVNDKEGGNWYGRSLLRACHSTWLVKDRLIRVDALKHERDGMGVPTGKAGPNTKRDGLLKLMSVVRAWKVGDTSAAVLPEGTDIELKGVQGTLPDTLASIKYSDEALARRFLAMF